MSPSTNTTVGATERSHAEGDLCLEKAEATEHGEELVPCDLKSLFALKWCDH